MFTGMKTPILAKDGSGRVVGFSYADGSAWVDIDEVDFTIRDPEAIRRLKAMDEAQRHADRFFGVDHRSFMRRRLR